MRRGSGASIAFQPRLRLGGHHHLVAALPLSARPLALPLPRASTRGYCTASRLAVQQRVRDPDDRSDSSEVVKNLSAQEGSQTEASNSLLKKMVEQYDEAHTPRTAAPDNRKKMTTNESWKKGAKPDKHQKTHPKAGAEANNKAANSSKWEGEKGGRPQRLDGSANGNSARSAHRDDQQTSRHQRHQSPPVARGSSGSSASVKELCDAMRFEDARKRFAQAPDVKGAALLIKAYGYKHMKDVDTAFRIYKDMLKAGLKPNTEVIGAMLLSSARAHPHRAIPYLWEEFLRFNVAPNDLCLSLFTTACAEIGMPDLAMTILAKAKESNVRLNNIDCVCLFQAVTNALTTAETFERMQTIFDYMTEGGRKLDGKIYVKLLEECISADAFEMGKVIHKHAAANGATENVIVGTALMQMYSHSGDLMEARAVFDGMPRKDVAAWTSLIQLYAEQKRFADVAQIINIMRKEGVELDNRMWSAALQSCADERALEVVKEWHQQIGQVDHRYVNNALVTAYGKCGSIADARRVFDSMAVHDTVSWTTIISGYLQNGQSAEALQLFDKMLSEGGRPDQFLWTIVFRACADCGDVALTQKFHEAMGTPKDAKVANTLASAYTKCGSLDSARQVFNAMPKRDVVSWHVIITAHIHHGRPREALVLFAQMQREGVVADADLWASVLTACGDIGDLQLARSLHAQITQQQRIRGDMVRVRTGTINMFAKCGSLEDARRLFEEINETDSAFTWSAMIAAYAEHGQPEEAIKLFVRMMELGIQPNIGTYIGTLHACATTPSLLPYGKQVHQLLVASGVTINDGLAEGLINMYSTGGDLFEAEQVFEARMSQASSSRKWLVSVWTAMIRALGKHGRGRDALALFRRFSRPATDASESTQTRLVPTRATFAALFNACTPDLVAELLPIGNSMEKTYGVKYDEQLRTRINELRGAS